MDKALIGEILYSDNERGRGEKREQAVRAKLWAKITKYAARLPFVEDLVAAYYCALDPATPARARTILFAALAYFILPTDWVPDFIVGFGFTDDIAVLSAALSIIRTHLKEVHYTAARRAIAGRQGRADAH